MGFSKTDKEKLKILGKRLKTIRNEKGLTLKELGYKTDKEPQSISRVEMGDINPTYLYLLVICEGLEINISELLNEK
ncbi:MAG: helix-turn-helix domain-containing protein [Chitinophagales bacterium]|nr:helix-turn-helix domain-containing protein [Chitinophagales bacterium]